MNWAKEFHIAMSPHASGGVYVNLMGQDEQNRIPMPTDQILTD